jgi:hypothetical protein
MPRYKAAHLREQGTDLIIIPLESNFGSKSTATQNAEIAELQTRANAADLKGTVVPVWDSGGGRMAFIAPQQWHPYFSSINRAYVLGNLNREIFW